MTKAEIYKALEDHGYDDTDAIKVKYIRQWLIDNEPPIGIKPYWIAIPQRISDLSKAIDRYSASPNHGRLIQQWTTEITALNSVYEALNVTYKGSDE